MKPGLIRWGAAGVLMLATAASAPAQRAPAGERYAQLIVRERILIRVPARLRTPAAQTARVEWKEGKGPRCVAARDILGAALLSQDSVDLVLKDRSRVRARLHRRCPALDYYYGFYISPNPDGLICAERDIIRSRVGGECEIDGFRTLTAVARD